MNTLKNIAKQVLPVKQLRVLKRSLKSISFSSGEYWESRYAKNGTSGPGSYNHLAAFKAEVINEFIKKQNIKTAIEFGCGDGNQLNLLECPQYIGLDVSQTAIRRCQSLYSSDVSKSFFLYNSLAFVDNAGLFRAELSLSLDVIFHIIEDNIFEYYMKHLFAAATRFVMIYSSDFDQRLALHVRHRAFSTWVEQHQKNWTLVQHKENPYPFDPEEPDKTTNSTFFIYAKKSVVEP